MNIASLLHTIRKRTRILSALAAAVLLAGLLPVDLHAQGPAKWQQIDLGLKSGFASELEWPGIGSALYFKDPLVGYYYTSSELEPNKMHYYGTVDGGVKWTELVAPVPVPYTFLNAQFGIASLGYTTRDAGQSWQRIVPKYRVDAFSYQVTSAVAATPSRYAALYQPQILDSATGTIRASDPKRLAFTLNDAATWTQADSMTVETISGTNDRKLELYDSSFFGRFPAPSGMADTLSVGWWQIYSMPDTATLIVGSFAFGRVPAGLENHFYLGRLNLINGNATWQKLPFVETVPSEKILPAGIQFVTSQNAFAIESSVTGSVTSYTMWSSSDGGATWTSASVPSWIDYASLRFVSVTHGIASNAVTSDGGKTWKAWGNLFEGGTFYAADSTHYYLANRFSLFARSTNAGRAWQRNDAGGLPRAIAAHSGRVLVGRNYRSLLVSSDYGRTWQDAERGGGLPNDLSTIWALAFSDTLGTPLRIVGVATMIPYDGDTNTTVIESTDGGLTWANRFRLPGVKMPGGPVSLQFFEDEVGMGAFLSLGSKFYFSGDRGLTWSLRDSLHYFQALSMADLKNGVQAGAAGIFTTTDGGANWVKTQTLPAARNRAIGLQAFSTASYAGLFPDRTQRNMNWDALGSLTGGQSWTVNNRTSAPRPLDGVAVWFDSTNLYAVGRGATLQLSTDRGHSFTSLKDSSADFRALGGWVYANSDRNYLYVAGPGNVAGRWEIVEVFVPVSAPMIGNSSLSMRVANPVSGNVLPIWFSLESASNVKVTVTDLLGSRVSEKNIGYRESGAHTGSLDLSDVRSGRYLVRLTTGSTSVSSAVVVQR